MSESQYEIRMDSTQKLAQQVYCIFDSAIPYTFCARHVFAST